MNDLIKYSETDVNNIYFFNGNNGSIISSLKNPNDMVKIFVMFCDNSLQSLSLVEKEKTLKDIEDVTNKLKDGNEDYVLIAKFLDDEVLKSNNAFAFSDELSKIKEVVNSIYNKFLREKTISKEKFDKRIHLLPLDSRYNSFIDWLTIQNPNKFVKFDYQKLLREINDRNDLFSQKTVTSIFREVDTPSSNLTNGQNNTPTTEQLTINSPYFNNNFSSSESSGGGPVNNSGIQEINSLNKPKTYTLKPPTSHGSSGFINWYTTLFIIVFSLVIGILTSVFLLK